MNWMLKLKAFLHDPPHKAYDFSPMHETEADTLSKAFGLTEVACLSRNADWDASAADRFVLPKGSKDAPMGGFWSPDSQARHPLSGQLLSELHFPGKDEATKAIKDTVPTFDTDDWHDRFWLTWRCWESQAAAIHPGLARLPADTRVPDATIWQHMSVTAAMEGTRVSQDRLAPAFLMFQIGPVQDFIAQARSTRDLWSGSFLLGWLMACALYELAEQVGPDAVVFPSLRGQPLYDWLNRDRLRKARFRSGDKASRSFWDEWAPQSAALLTPNLPNRCLALVPADFDPAPIAQAVQAEWKRIAATCYARLHAPDRPLDRARWDAQIRRAFQINWQLWSWSDVAQSIEAWGQFNAESAKRLERARQMANRNFPGWELSAAWAWSAHCAICAHRLDARRQTRDFGAWTGAGQPTHPKGCVKDAFSGREEALILPEWLAAAHKDPELAALFRHDDLLSAPNLVKRVWHSAYLDAVQNLRGAKDAFASVPAIAAAPWRARLPADLVREWNEAVKQDEAGETDAPAAQRNSRQITFQGKHATIHGRPSRYFAVLSLDGDGMGRWIAGEKCPSVREVLAANAVAYFEQPDHRSAFDSWLDSPRPVSPSFHLQFSEALSNFALYAAPAIVRRHYGELIYAGGDDVLALLPADEAMSCALALRDVFRLPVMDASVLPSSRPSVLLLPGPTATVSVGIAIAHVKSPLQDAIQAARAAEQRAKGKHGATRPDDRTTEESQRGDAVAVTLCKRSGERIEWREPFGSPAWPLLAFYRERYRPKSRGGLSDDPPIGAKFPYRLAELLAPYGAGERLDPALAAIEFAWTIGRQAEGLKPSGEQAELSALARNWIEALASRGATYADFLGLFAIEAFLERQEEG